MRTIRPQRRSPELVHGLGIRVPACAPVQPCTRVWPRRRRRRTGAGRVLSFGCELRGRVAGGCRAPTWPRSRWATRGAWRGRTPLRPGYADGTTSGSGGTTAGPRTRCRLNGDDSIALVTSASTACSSTCTGARTTPGTGTGKRRTWPTTPTNHLFVVTDGTGQTLKFYEFSGSTPSGRGGKLKSVADVDGQLTEVTSWSGGNPTEVQRTTGAGGSALTESFGYTYVASGTNAGLLESVTQRTKVGAGRGGARCGRWITRTTTGPHRRETAGGCGPRP